MTLAVLGGARVFAGDDGTAALAARIVILANAGDAGSLRVARHYAEARGVPRENIIALPMRETETIPWRVFVRDIWEPLTRELVARKWLDVAGENPRAKDAIGRTQRVIAGHRIAYLVVCCGVPLRIEHDGTLIRENDPAIPNAAFRTSQGSVDGELSALARGNYPINGFVRNELFLKENPTALQEARVVKVARLDGPDAASAMALVDNALAAEKIRAANPPGKKGRAYVDFGGGVTPMGNVWLERTAKDFERAGCDVAVENTPATFAADAPFDDARFYFGWYAWNANGPFVRDDFRFPPGAVALHIHSFSAATLRSKTQGWCGPFIARGVTATFGNVYEPYLTLTHHPYAVAEALLRGERMGDAAYYALPALSWQQVFIGDPLFKAWP